MAPAPQTPVTSSATPLSSNTPKYHHPSSSRDEEEGNTPRNGLVPPRYGKDSRSLSNASIFGPRTASLANSAAPGSFSSNLTATNGFRGNVRLDIGAYSQVPDPRVEEISASEKRQAELRDQIEKEMKIKMGSENLLDALMAKPAKQSKGQRMKVETELNTSNRKLAAFKAKLQEEIDSQKRPEPIQSRLSSLFRGSPLRSPIHLTGPGEEQMYEEELEAQSPTYLLGEILQALEVEGMPPDYYVVRANGLVELFKRHPTLKYDLAWSIFGLRVQMMLLSESREVIAAGYRVTRHAIADRKSLQTIRALQTDYPVILSLAKDSKATIEREQALKFVRAFLDVKDGVKEISNAVVRAVVSVAEHYEDRLRSIALLTLTEILVRSPALLIRGGGITPLSDALRDGTYAGSESIVSAFLYVTDAPQLRKYLSSGLELQGPFGLFSDPGTSHSHEERLKTNARSIAATINSWPGLFALSHNGFASISSLLRSLSHPNHFIRNLVLDLLFDILHIKPPSWTTSFLAGRRLTTYGRGANLRTDMEEKHSRLESDDDLSRANLVNHYTTLVLFVLLRCGLIEALTGLSRDIEDQFVIRKTTLLLSEVLKLADHALPNNISAPLPALPEIMEDFSQDSFLADIVPSKMAFQFDSVNRTLHRTRAHARKASKSAFNAGLIGAEPPDTVKSKVAVDMDEVRFRVLMTDSNVLTSSNYFKWKWPAIQEIVEGPLAIPKRLEDAKSTKFLKRLIGFYRPFKYQFSEARNTKPNERYVRVGCSLMKCLLKLPEGVQYLYENKLLRQLAECLAQLDRMSGITSSAPMFAESRLTDTLTWGYFNILGALSSEPQGLVMMSRWRMINMFYHIIQLRDRDDIVQQLLGSMDFTLDSHLRVMLSKALTSSPKAVRIHSTKLLRRYATQEISPTSSTTPSNAAFWAIRLLVTQLYDPDVEVSEVAVQILEESCNRKQYLEYVVKCRPALDHLGEIGAPLLLRFLSTSTGYQYLDGLDYITHEMDDWFLGRNEKYVTLVEASLSRAFSYEPVRPKSVIDPPFERQALGLVPPHFYRELTRTKEGCKLLRDSGHFEEFVSTIKDFWAEDEDAETILKVKGCLWAVGNVGSMDLGAPFLENSNVVQWILRIVEKSTVMTMRGTAFFVLGLISRNWHGMEMLAEKGWDVATDNFGDPRGYVLPPKLQMIFPDSLNVALAQPASLTYRAEAPPSIDDNDPFEKKVYSSVMESCNTVLSRRALNDLNSLKNRKPHLFKSAVVFRRILYILECHTVRLPIRQRIIDMFDKDVMRQIVAGDDEEDEEGEEEEEEEGTEDEDEDDDDDEESQPNTARPILPVVSP